MTRRNLPPAFGLIANGLVPAMLVVLAVSAGGRSEASRATQRPDIAPSAGAVTSRLPKEGIAARAVLDPRITLFGDTIVAQVDVVLDRRKVDPQSVRIGTAFLPWEVVGQP